MQCSVTAAIWEGGGALELFHRSIDLAGARCGASSLAACPGAIARQLRTMAAPDA